MVGSGWHTRLLHRHGLGYIMHVQLSYRLASIVDLQISPLQFSNLKQSPTSQITPARNRNSK
jgi:hypothetical protein